MGALKVILIILSVILGLILITAVIVGVTIYQAVQLGKAIEETSSSFEEDFEALSQGDCSKVSDIEGGLEDMKKEIAESCKKPILKVGIEEFANDRAGEMGLDVEAGEISCENFDSIFLEIEGRLELAQEICDNGMINSS